MMLEEMDTVYAKMQEKKDLFLHHGNLLDLASDTTNDPSNVQYPSKDERKDAMTAFFEAYKMAIEFGALARAYAKQYTPPEGFEEMVDNAKKMVASGDSILEKKINNNYK